nr:p64 [Carnation yellow fleck virus]
MCFEYNTLKSTYLKNIDSFNDFLHMYLPLLSEVFILGWDNPAPDVRLLFELQPSELLLKIPTVNIHNSTFLFRNKLGLLESYFEDDSNESLRAKIDSLLQQDNPELGLAQRWIGFHCYYGEYRTAKTRKVKRADVYKLPKIVGDYTINMTNVEEFFSELQKNMPSISVRRRFCGSLATEAFSIFKKFGIGFPPITRLNVPIKYSYLNVDYYRYVKRSGLTSDELTILSNIEFDVAEMCCEKEVALQAHRAQRSAKPFQKQTNVIDDKFSLNRASNTLKPRNDLLNLLWKDAGARRQRRDRPLLR